MSVVIPARNEAARIGACLEGLRNASALEVLVVDDSSTDDTAVIAVAHGAKIVNAPPLPEGWVGKPWALQQGLDAASGEWVLFLDADTRPEPSLIEAMTARAEGDDIDLLSASAEFQTRSAVQTVLHASFLAGLVYRFGAIGTAFSSRRPLISGQCFLVRRQWLQDHGGFRAIRSHMTDDIALARYLGERGARLAFVDGSKLIAVEMYASTRETWNEWGRSLPMADVISPRERALDVALLFLTQVLPLARVLCGRGTRLDVMLLTIRTALMAPLTNAFSSHRRWTLLAPLADTATTARLAYAWFKPAKRWRGREYAPARSASR